MGKIPEFERLKQITQIENVFWQDQNAVAAGMDEVGRGPLAGPVVAACVVLPPEPLIEYINDSKKLSPKRRETLYVEIKALAKAYALGWVEPGVIDELNILNATRLAFQKAFLGVEAPVTDVLVDALKGLDILAKQHAFIKGDEKCYLIAAASIIAKVERDKYMVEQDKKYPMYGFAQNKGYGTAAHMTALKKYGPCPIHRRSFIKNLEK